MSKERDEEERKKIVEENIYWNAQRYTSRA